jgi:hypothetical protein
MSLVEDRKAKKSHATPAAKRVVGIKGGYRKPVSPRPIAHVDVNTDSPKDWRAEGALPPAGHNLPPETLAEDLLVGAEAIAAELGIGMRKAFYWLERSLIPARKTGRTWVASRRRLRQHFGAE